MALIRQALGSIREPISQEALGDLVGFDKYKISRLERGAQPMSRDDAIAIAKVDPLQRGPAWLMFGEQDEGEQGARLRNNRPLPTPDTIERVDVQGVPTKQQPVIKKKSAKPRPGDRTAVA